MSPIPQNKCGTGELALGIMFAPNGNNEDETTHLRNKTEKWADLIRVGNLSHQESWVALQSTIFKTIEYALPAMCLTKKQVDFILAPAMDVGLSKSGICRKLARAVVFAPLKYLGLGVKHQFVTQGVRKLEAFFDHGQPFTMQLIETAWYRTMIQSGLGADFLEENSFLFRACLPNGWITSLWEFLSTYAITLRRNKSKFHRNLRMHSDRFIMKDVFNSQQWTSAEKEQFNCCRLYLRVELISDIMTADGLAIRRHIWSGKIDECWGQDLQPRET
jgi:hypothetical protein